MDSTAVVIEEMQRLDKNLANIEHKANIGKSECLMDGFKVASGRLIGFIDADYQFHPQDFPMLLESLERGECDLTNALREKRKDPLTKRDTSRIFNSINAVAFRGLNAPDWNSGQKKTRSKMREDQCYRSQIL